MWPILLGRGGALLPLVGWHGVGRASRAPWCPQGIRRHGWPGIPRDCKSPSSFYKQELLSLALNTHGRLFQMLGCLQPSVLLGHYLQLRCTAAPPTHNRHSHTSSLAASKDSHDATSTGSKVKSQGGLSLHTSFNLGSMIYQRSSQLRMKPASWVRASRSWDRFSLHTSLSHASPFLSAPGVLNLACALAVPSSLLLFLWVSAWLPLSAVRHLLSEPPTLMSKPLSCPPQHLTLTA